MVGTMKWAGWMEGCEIEGCRLDAVDWEVLGKEWLIGDWCCENFEWLNEDPGSCSSCSIEAHIGTL